MNSDGQERDHCFRLAIIAVACFGALLGASAWFAHAVLFIGSWIAAGWVAWKYAKLIQPEAEQLVGSTELAYSWPCWRSSWLP